MKIEICGGIASGKTTLATLLEKNRLLVIFEDFQANPFWKQFYSDPQRFAFETEITFLLQHYNQIKVADEADEPFACDFSYLLDRAYAEVTLDDDQRQAFYAVYDEARKHTGPADLIVHLRCGVAEELARIRRRGRGVEAGIKKDYLAALNEAVARRVAAAKPESVVIEIDSEKNDFANDPVTQQAVVEEILSAFGG